MTCTHTTIWSLWSCVVVVTRVTVQRVRITWGSWQVTSWWYGRSSSPRSLGSWPYSVQPVLVRDHVINSALQFVALFTKHSYIFMQWCNCVFKCIHSLIKHCMFPQIMAIVFVFTTRSIPWPRVILLLVAITYSLLQDHSIYCTWWLITISYTHWRVSLNIYKRLSTRGRCCHTTLSQVTPYCMTGLTGMIICS